MKFNRRKALFVMGMSAACGLPSLEAAKPQKQTHIVIYVKNMHCNNCAKRVASQLYKVPGIVKVAANVKKNYAVVTPQKNKSPSPKKMWDATVAAKLVPVKLVTPQNVFTKPPLK